MPIKYLLALLNSKLMEFYFGFEGIMTAGGAFTLKHETISILPIKLKSGKLYSTFAVLVNYVLSCKGAKSSNYDVPFSYFEQIIDGMVFELYFEEELKEAGRDVLKYLTDLKPITDDMSDEQKLEIIESEFNRLYDKDHPVRNNLFYMDSIPEIRIIKGLDKDADK